MLHPSTEQALRTQLAVALRERDEWNREAGLLRAALITWQRNAEKTAAERDALRAENGRLREDIADLLPMAERAHHADLGKHLCPDIGSLPEGLRIAREGALLLRLHHPDIASPTGRPDVDVAQTALARLIAVLDSPFVNVEATATTAAELTEAMSQARAALTGGGDRG